MKRKVKARIWRVCANRLAATSAAPPETNSQGIAHRGVAALEFVAAESYPACVKRFSTEPRKCIPEI